ncbi:MAG: hypothetical protein PHN88_10390 [Ignavibacteria bacterium]|nr:hypothetical protein [Ignavibacteria bacterium]
MKLIVTFLLVFAFCVSLNAQDAGKNSKSAKEESCEKILIQGAGEIPDFVFPDTCIKMQSGYEQFKTDIKSTKTIKTNNIQICSYDDDNSCSNDKSGSCTSNIFLWGAVSLLTGIFAIAGIKGR